MDWQPIETVPKEEYGNRVLLWAIEPGEEGHPIVCWWTGDDWTNGDLYFPADDFSHWIKIDPPIPSS